MCRSRTACGYSFNSFARISNDRTSPQEPLAMYRCFANCLTVSSSCPSAIFAEIDIEALSIWFLIEKFRQFSNRIRISFARSMASCHTIKSSNLFEVGICRYLSQIIEVPGHQNNYSLNQLNILPLHLLTCFASIACFARFASFTQW